MTKRRVVITGIGIVSPVGIGLSEFWKNILAGVSGVDRSPILVDSDCPCKIAAEIKDFHPEQWLGRKEAKRMDRFAHFGLVAAYLAQEDAALDLDKADRDRIGVVTGTVFSGTLLHEQEYDTYCAHGSQAVSPYAAVGIFTGSCGSQISIHLGLRASSVTIGTGCECSTTAVAHAADLIKLGNVDVMFAGGADATIRPSIISAFCVNRALSSRNSEPQQACRPYDLKRDGFVMGEGGCMLVLEELEHARRRGARIYAEMTGWATTCDAYHITHPNPSGEQAARALQLALAQAGVPPAQVDYLNAHGTSTSLGDIAETALIKQVFGEHAYRIPVSSVKSTMGHMQGGCGASELATCCLALRDNILPPTSNYEYPDPACDLDYVPNQSRNRHLDVVVKNSFGFGGRNAVVVLQRYRNGTAPHNPGHNGNGNGGHHP